MGLEQLRKLPDFHHAAAESTNLRRAARDLPWMDCHRRGPRSGIFPLFLSTAAKGPDIPYRLAGWLARRGILHDLRYYLASTLGSRSRGCESQLPDSESRRARLALHLRSTKPPTNEVS